MFLFWLVIIVIVSIVWALIALISEKNKKELTKAKEKIAQGRVIFHSSDSSDTSSS